MELEDVMDGVEALGLWEMERDRVGCLLECVVRVGFVLEVYPGDVVVLRGSEEEFERHSELIEEVGRHEALIVLSSQGYFDG